jgi:hypothetical protein
MAGTHARARPGRGKEGNYNGFSGLRGIHTRGPRTRKCFREHIKKGTGTIFLANSGSAAIVSSWKTCDEKHACMNCAGSDRTRGMKMFLHPEHSARRNPTQIDDAGLTGAKPERVENLPQINVNRAFFYSQHHALFA